MTRKTIVHVNRQNIARNTKTDKAHDDGELSGSEYQSAIFPVLTAKDYRSNRKGQSAEITVDGRVIGRFCSEWAGAALASGLRSTKATASPLMCANSQNAHNRH